MNRVLLYRRGGLGDTLLTFPVAEVLKRKGFEVHFVGNRDYLEFAYLCGWADKIYSSEFLSSLDLSRYQEKILISCRGNLNPFPESRIPITYYYLKSLGLPFNFSRKLPIFEDEPGDKNLAVLHPGSGSPKKNPPLELFEKIEAYLVNLGFTVIYLAGEAEDWLFSKKKNLFRSFNILEIASFLKRAGLFIGNDSGISHLASYLGIKSFLFYGPTDEVIFSPLGETSHLIFLPLSCRPCFPKTCSERPCLDPENLFKVFKKALHQNITLHAYY
jgi:ADP-heptose:LPS heptosyltransferase